MQVGTIRKLFMLPAICLALMAITSTSASAEGFQASLAKIDGVLGSRPAHVHIHALESCQKRRNVATRLYYSGEEARAERALKYCFILLKIAELPKAPPIDRASLQAKARAEVKARADKELDLALSLKPNLENGLKVYRECASCHMPEGWGLSSGLVPQLAGQHRNVVIKQLADIRTGLRHNPMMEPYSSAESIGGAQSVSDVAGYIDTLEISTLGGKGDGKDLKLGEKLYKKNCVACHGATGAGDNDTFTPRIQAQQYNYLVYQFEQIKSGERRNAHPGMVTQIEKFTERQMHAVLDFVSRLEPPEDLQAPDGWRNPDFAEVASADAPQP